MVAHQQRVALTRVNVHALPSLQCVAPAGSAEGESRASREDCGRRLKDCFLNPRINSTLPLYSLYRNTCRFTRKHSRMSLIAAAALAAGAVGATTADFAPQALAAGTATPSAHVTAIAQVDSPIIPGTGEPAKAVDVPRASDWATEFSHTHTAAEQSPAAHNLISPALTVQPPTAQPPAAQATAAQNPAAASTAPAVGAKGQAAPAQPAKPPAHTARTHAAQPHPAASRPAAAHPAVSHRAPAAPWKPFLIYDSVTPSSIPAGQQVATYANGAYAASAKSVGGRGNVLWIDTNGSDPRANALDVEPGDATPSGAAQWVKAKLSGQPDTVAIVYTMLSDWQAVKGYVGGLPSSMQARVRYWIADPTGVAHVVPGSNATQWYWGQNYDITTANPGFES
jgi:hypothetical protein